MTSDTQPEPRTAQTLVWAVCIVAIAIIVAAVGPWIWAAILAPVFHWTLYIWGMLIP